MTSVLAAEHLLPGNITAVLDTPIFFRGELQGMLSLEQVGARVSFQPVVAAGTVQRVGAATAI